MSIKYRTLITGYLSNSQVEQLRELCEDIENLEVFIDYKNFKSDKKQKFTKIEQTDWEMIQDSTGHTIEYLKEILDNPFSYEQLFDRRNYKSFSKETVHLLGLLYNHRHRNKDKKVSPTIEDDKLEELFEDEVLIDRIPLNDKILDDICNMTPYSMIEINNRIQQEGATELNHLLETENEFIRLAAKRVLRKKNEVFILVPHENFYVNLKVLQEIAKNTGDDIDDIKYYILSKEIDYLQDFEKKGHKYLKEASDNITRLYNRLINRENKSE